MSTLARAPGTGASLSARDQKTRPTAARNKRTKKRSRSGADEQCPHCGKLLRGNKGMQAHIENMHPEETHKRSDVMKSGHQFSGSASRPQNKARDGGAKQGGGAGQPVGEGQKTDGGVKQGGGSGEAGSARGGGVQR